MQTVPRYRIGELARRAGITTDLLRAWERRYDLLRPSRSAGGFRLYSDGDAARVSRMQEHLAAGMSAAEAARVTLAEDGGAEQARDTPPRDAHARRLRRALDRLDEDEAQAALDALMGSLTLDSVLRDVVLPYLHDLGERWAAGETSVAYEHFASNLLRGHLLALARGWGRGGAPTALLACAPGELHDLPLIALGLALRARGWRIVFLGPDTPVATVAEAASDVGAAVVVVSGVVPERFADATRDLRALGEHVRLAIGGAGASGEIAETVRAEHLDSDPVTAADTLAASVR